MHSVARPVRSAFAAFDGVGTAEDANLAIAMEEMHWHRAVHPAAVSGRIATTRPGQRLTAFVQGDPPAVIVALFGGRVGDGRFCGSRHGRSPSVGGGRVKKYGRFGVKGSASITRIRGRALTLDVGQLLASGDGAASNWRASRYVCAPDHPGGMPRLRTRRATQGAKPMACSPPPTTVTIRQMLKTRAPALPGGVHELATAPAMAAA